MSPIVWKQTSGAQAVCNICRTSPRSISPNNRLWVLLGKRRISALRPVHGNHLTIRPNLQSCQAWARQAGPTSPAPSYDRIDRQPWNRLIMGLFRRKMVQELGEDSKLHGYHAIIDLTRKLNTRFDSPEEVQEATRRILKSLFPRWLLPAFRVMFSRPFPAFSHRLNAWVTALACQWLMGPSVVNAVEQDDGRIAAGHGVLVERCRYLEEAGCAAVCLNSCKLPTQEFFARDMGLALEMRPNYEDFSCQFAFGKFPTPPAEDPVFSTPCFSQCPSGRSCQQCPSIAVGEGQRVTAGAMA